MVLTGTLTDGDQYTLTLTPDRVWKGKPSARTTVYVLGIQSLDSYSFQPGERYLIAARVLRRDERRSINIDDRVGTVFGFDRPCGAPLPLSLAPELDKLVKPRVRH